MEIDPRAQFRLFAACFLVGALLAALLFLLAALRALLGGYTPPARFRAAFSRPLPLVHRAAYTGKRVSRAWSKALTIATDVLFCLICAISAVLLLYEYHDGVVRPFALFSLFAGLFAMRALTSKASEVALAVLALVLAVTRVYLVALLLLPFRLSWRLLLWALVRPIRAAFGRLQRKRLAACSASLCRAQLALAADGFVTNGKECEKVEKPKKKAGSHGACDSRVDHCRVSRCRRNEHRRHRGAS